MENLRYSIYDNNIISDVFGEEVVLVNLESGVYYSLRESAAQMWIRIIEQYSTTEILTDLNQIYQVGEHDVASDINIFVAQLLEKKIIKIVTGSEKKSIDFKSKGTLVTYKTPVLETFSDMQEILLLDPVHDVDKAGWPISKNLDTQS
ncbi:MAG: PqqD family protein [Spirosomataceae bacterium]